MIGVVKGYGRIIKYEDGWRFQKGEIVALTPGEQDKITFRDRITYDLVFGKLTHQRERQSMPSDIERPFVYEMLTQHYPNATFYETKEELFSDWGAGVQA